MRGQLPAMLHLVFTLLMLIVLDFHRLLKLMSSALVVLLLRGDLFLATPVRVCTKNTAKETKENCTPSDLVSALERVPLPGLVLLKFILRKGPHGALPQLCWAVAYLFPNFEGISRD